MKYLFRFFSCIVLFVLASCSEGGTKQYVEGEILGHWRSEEGEYSEDYYLIKKEDGTKTLEAYMEDVEIPSLHRIIEMEKEVKDGTFLGDGEEYAFEYMVELNGNLSEWGGGEKLDEYKKVD